MKPHPSKARQRRKINRQESQENRTFLRLLRKQASLLKRILPWVMPPL
jgi:hypothetical protein